MGLTIGAGLGIVHHGPEMLSFMGLDGGADMAAGAGTVDATAFAAEKYACSEFGVDEAIALLSKAQADSLASVKADLAVMEALNPSGDAGNI